MSSEVREQVFVSSTFIDLIEERQEVIQTLLEAGCIPAGMELFPASDDDKWALIQRVIDECDYYVLVVGGRYGSVDPDGGLSYTEKEFDYAVETRKPIMAFVHGEPGSIPASKTELSPEAREKLDSFREKVQRRAVKFWTTPSDLGGQVAKSLIHARRTHPAEGWIRASNAVTPELETELAQLRARVIELTAELEKSQRSAHSSSLDGGVLAQGQDTYSFEILVKYRPATTGPGRYSTETFVLFEEVAWDSLFATLAPSLLDESSERKLRSNLNAAAESLFLESDDAKLPENFDGYLEVVAPANVLDDFKVQFFALNLLEQSKKKHVASDSNAYWSLTSTGRDHLLRLRAVRRSVDEISE